MLDQNTDRMWYVIGAVLIGAAIILIANGSLPQMFASVTGSYENVLSNVIYTGPIDMEVDVGAVNYNDTVDVKLFADSELGISNIEMVDGPEIVASKDVLSFDGEDSYLDMHYNFGNANAFTIGAWVNDVSGNNFLVNHDTGGGWSLLSNSSIKTEEGGSRWLYDDEDSSSIGVIGDNETSYVVQTWDGDTVTYYINGTKVSEFTDVTGTFELESLFIGSRANSKNEPIREPTNRSSGQILEFFMFQDRALTEQEVRQSFDQGLDSQASNLVLHYNFVDGSGDVVPDLSPIEHDAINHGGRWIPMYRVSENGTYTFRVTDNEGNVREQEVTISEL